MLQRIVSALAALVLALGLGFIVSSNAVAAPTPMGGGSGIIIDNQLVCTLTTIGHDNGGRLVGITAGHCGGPGSFVIPESNEEAGVVGTFVESNPDLDYGVIQFDPGKVTPVRTVGAATITSIGAPASFPATACKEGRTTGTTCGVVWGDLSADASTWTQICVDHGDSGSPGHGRDDAGRDGQRLPLGAVPGAGTRHQHDLHRGHDQCPRRRRRRVPAHLAASWDQPQTAPPEADPTSLEYLANTPRV